MSSEIQFANELIEFIHNSPSEFHVVENARAILEQHGFEQLDPGSKWELSPGGKYFASTNGSAFIAFALGSGELPAAGFRVIESHTDSPTIKVKPQPEMVAADHYLKLNAEVYGSPIWNTWLDRPLTLAGRVSIRTDDPFHPRDVLVRFDRPLLYIPNLSIHHNKDVNSGAALNQQKDLIPILGIIDDNFSKEGFLIRVIAEQLGLKPEVILDFELSMSEFERGCVMGLSNEFISSTRLDNLSLLHAGVRALAESSPGDATTVLCCVDNEEVGNRTRQGADSSMLAATLERVVLARGGGRGDYHQALSNSFMISADVSHALHPNVPERSDPVVGAKLNKGPVIKFSGAQKFTSDSNSIAVFKRLCDEADVPCQYYVNRSDSPGGSSAGPASITQAAMRAVDIGIPVFAMHSIRELCGVMDNHFVYLAFARFFA